MINKIVDNNTKKIILQYATDQISETELYSKLYDFKGDKKKIIHYEKAIKNNDNEALEYLAMLPKKKYDLFIPIYRKLIQECWHNQHEEIARFFQFFVRDEGCVDPVAKAMHLNCEHWYDDGDAFIRKCAYVLATLKTNYAIEKLKELSKSKNKLIKKYCTHQLEKLGLIN